MYASKAKLPHMHGRLFRIVTLLFHPLPTTIVLLSIFQPLNSGLLLTQLWTLYVKFLLEILISV